jgi:hypothetical protein
MLLCVKYQQRKDVMKKIIKTDSLTAYSYADALKLISPYLKEGYEIDFETNEGYPQQIGVVFTATVNSVVEEPEPDEVPTEEPVLDVVATEEVKKLTRRAKLNAS